CFCSKVKPAARDGGRRVTGFVQRIKCEFFVLAIGREDDNVAVASDAEDAIANADRGAVKVAAETLPKVLLAGGEIEAGDCTAVLYQEEQVTSNDRCRHLRDAFFEVINFIHGVAIRLGGDE